MNAQAVELARKLAERLIATSCDLDMQTGVLECVHCGAEYQCEEDDDGWLTPPEGEEQPEHTERCITMLARRVICYEPDYWRQDGE